MVSVLLRVTVTTFDGFETVTTDLKAGTVLGATPALLVALFSILYALYYSLSTRGRRALKENQTGSRACLYGRHSARGTF